MVPPLSVTRPTASLKLTRSKVPPLTVTAPFESALLAPYLSVPALTVVRPVYKFAPDNIKVPAPTFVSAPVVLVLAPEIVNVLAVTSMEEIVPVDKV